MHIILHQPQIPQNVGNIVRTCAVTGSDLTLVMPLGFLLSDRRLKRAGLDYWEGVNVQKIEDLEAYLESSEHNFYFLSSKSQKSYTDISFHKEDILIFGSETEGLPSKYVERWPERFYRIPMVPEARCLNLATSVGIVVYEAARQIGFSSVHMT